VQRKEFREPHSGHVAKLQVEVTLTKPLVRARESPTADEDRAVFPAIDVVPEDRADEREQTVPGWETRQSRRLAGDELVFGKVVGEVLELPRRDLLKADGVRLGRTDRFHHERPSNDPRRIEAPHRVVKDVERHDANGGDRQLREATCFVAW